MSVPHSSRFRDFFGGLWARVLLTSRLARFLGEKQARYMASLIEMLEGHRFEEALRHAIPLSDEIVKKISGISFGLPRLITPRLSLFGRAPGKAIAVGGLDLNSKLRDLYRIAASELERAGKIEEAAYVLADLLNVPEQAVSLLERHGQLELAAKLAEGRKLAPDLVVRQWFLAGNRKRAVALARRHEVFELAVRRLERTHFDDASELRIEWANSLADRGAFAQACHVLWPVAYERDRAREWLEIAIAHGGVAGAEALGKKLLLAPEIEAETLTQIATVFAGEDEDDVTTRVALVRALGDSGDGARFSSAMRLGLRSLLRDAARPGVAVPKSEIDDLAKRCGDGVLRADLPQIHTVANDDWKSRTTTLSIRIGADDRGVAHIFDAALLERNIVALALGEAGVILVDRNGRTVAHLDQPAHRLVISDRLDRGIALAHRGDSMRLAKLDFAARTAKYWVDARMELFADSYDGATWYTALGSELSAIDATSDRFESIWYNPDAGPFLFPLVRTPKSLVFINRRGESWRYELPSLMLRGRTAIVVKEGVDHFPLPDGGVLATEWGNDRTVLRIGSKELPFIVEDAEVAFAVADDSWIAVVTSTGFVCLLDPQTQRVRARVEMEVTPVPSIRLQPNALSVFDAFGRLVVLDLQRGAILRDQRI